MPEYYRSETSLGGTLDTTIHEQTHTAGETHTAKRSVAHPVQDQISKVTFEPSKVLNAALACCRCATTATTASVS